VDTVPPAGACVVAPVDGWGRWSNQSSTASPGESWLCNSSSPTVSVVSGPEPGGELPLGEP